ncbi:PREDICTED: uncharacterized protein LOC109156003 isoform X2 [Ipomoea nil]|uniref:uncharacterized protein LOC109156003 isoform X2 n=1 Tax=Ipomoea nil TaxID=35883 RepID=UPI00090200ED|nr:PREDICTED: uncharacterized protein LOC109156003 isoform X2 [Ipomoea nil]
MAPLAAATGSALSVMLPPTPAKTSIHEHLRNNHHHQEPKICNQLRIPLKLHSQKLHLYTKHQPFKAMRSTRQLNRQKPSSIVCAAASASAQTLPRVDKPKTANTAPQQDKTTFTPRLDDSGPSLPPRYGGGGGGGGGGSPSSGGFFLFGFLLILSYLKEEEEKLLESKRNRE